AMIGARGAVDAHLLGAMGGLGMALVEKGFHRRIFG
ncbi:rhombosortase, partial [Vibrio sp. 970]|nr:rhombosortase [Vibrio sp. 970]